jgi:hypothetical protein
VLEQVVRVVRVITRRRIVMAETGDADGLGSTPPQTGRNGHDVVDDQVIDLTDRSSRPLASYVEETTGLRIEVHRPIDSPRRWRQYLDGAEARYRAHGVVSVLARERLEDGRATALFFVVVDDADHVVGGIRCHGPLQAPEDAYAMEELAGHPRLPSVRDLISRTIPSGLVEIKGAWIDRDQAPRGVSDALARCHVHAMTWFGARFAMCTCSDSVARRWATAGGRAFIDLETVAYPDDRYRTVLLMWDRERLTDRTSAHQWTAILREQGALHARPGVEIVEGPNVPAPRRPEWQAELLDDQQVNDAVRLLLLQADPGIDVLDELPTQRQALDRVRSSPVADPDAETPRWAYFPWRRSLVHVLGPRSYRALRLDRNRNKITADEQERLSTLKVGVVGLSVGHAIAHAIALEGICGELRLADFDDLELSNLNRIPATVLDLGLNKAVVAARRIAEIDPYLQVSIEPAGLDEHNLDQFVSGLDVVIEECDSLDVKALVREAARRARVPVVMETSDRGLLDVERYDLEPDRPIFHGLLGDVNAADLRGLTTHDKVPHVLRILEPAQLSSRMAASMAEIDETLTTWPQLGGDVLLGAATVATAVRAIGLGRPLPSGRTRVDVGSVLDGLVEPAAPYVIDLTDGANPATSTAPTEPTDPVAAVVRAANLAPSGGNAQPWRLDPQPDRLDIHLDRTRGSSMDVWSRGSYVAIGAALLNARSAAATSGVLGGHDLFPSTTDTDLVARLHLAGGTDPGLAALYPAVWERATNRHPGDGSALPPETAEALRRQVEIEGATLHLLTDRAAIDAYTDLLAESDRLRFLTPHMHREMMGELRWPGLDRLDTGIDVRTLELDPADLAKLQVARRADVMAELARWDAGRALGDTSRNRVPTSSAIALVTVRGHEPIDHVRGGGGLQRLWLTAELEGWAVQPVSPVTVFALDDDDLEGLSPPGGAPRLRAIDRAIRELAGITDEESFVLIVRLSRAPRPSLRSERLEPPSPASS